MNNRVTRGANFNKTRPEDVELLNWIDSFENQSEVIKCALRAYRQGGEPPASSPIQPAAAPVVDTMTSQERNDLVLQIASLQQQLEESQAAAAGGVSVETGQPVAVPASSGRPLSESFKANVKKVARPGIRLGE